MPVPPDPVRSPTGSDGLPESIRTMGFKTKEEWDKAMEKVYWAGLEIDRYDEKLTMNSFLAGVSSRTKIPVAKLNRMYWVNWHAVDVKDSRFNHEDTAPPETVGGVEMLNSRGVYSNYHAGDN